MYFSPAAGSQTVSAGVRQREKMKTEHSTNLVADISLRPLVFTGVGIVILWVVSGLVVYFRLGTWADRGNFGDTFGAVNALFAGLAFSGMIFTILLQRRELALQREELKLTRMELQRSAEAQEKSQHTLSLQVQEQRFSARLAAATSLVSIISRHVDHLKTFGDQDRLKNLKVAEQSLSRYEQILEQMFEESMNQHEQEKEVQQSGSGCRPNAAGLA